MIRSVLFLVMLQLACQSAFARPEILDDWETLYPNASSALRNCQLCHEQVTGGNGWNPYGWTIRNLLESFTAIEAIEEAETGNSDVDSGGSSNMLEIESGTQPGWTTGSSNTIRYRPGTLATKSIAANTVLTDPLTLTNLDLPPATTNPFSARIPTGANGTVTEVASGVVNANVTLVSPIHATYAPGLPGLLFVADQVGVVHKIDLNNPNNSEEFIDISSFVQTLGANYDERGLLGFAFHPDFAANGLFYTHHSEPAGTAAADFPLNNANHQSVISEWSAINPGTVGTLGQTGTKRNLLRIDQPASNHNGGGLVFDQNNYLLIALGDGGGADDIFENGNNPLTPLGSILRIDPAGASSANGMYSVPSDNPFVTDMTKLNEAFAFGLRNPFSLAIDRANNRIYSGDVGQNDIEEINRIRSGENYGWNAKEGSLYFFPNLAGSGFVSTNPSTRADASMIDPILEYDRDDGISAVGGPVYRGSSLTELSGAYLFGDWAGSSSQGRLFFSSDFSTEQEIRINGGSGLNMFLTGFGEDSSGEIYLLGKTQVGPSGTTGMIKQLTAFEMVEPSEPSEEMCFPISVGAGKIATICL